MGDERETTEARLARLEEKFAAQEKRIESLEKHEEEHRDILDSIHEMTLTMRDLVNSDTATKNWIKNQDDKGNVLTDLRMTSQMMDSKIGAIDERLKSIEEEKSDKSRSIWKFVVGGVVAALVAFMMGILLEGKTKAVDLPDNGGVEYGFCYKVYADCGSSSSVFAIRNVPKMEV